MKAQQTNDYWLRHLSSSYGDPRTLDLIRTVLDDLRAVKPQDVQAAAATYLTDAKEYRIEITAAAGAVSPKP